MISLRASGILMPLFSLPSNYGIGSLGEEAYAFVDFLKKAGQKYWQLLPLVPTNFGDSPYQSFSSYAGNPYFIDLDILCKNGLLEREDYINVDFGSDPTHVDYEKLYNNRYKVLKIAFSRFKGGRAFDEFCKAHEKWLCGYALFMALKDEAGGKSWREWASPLKFRESEALLAAEKRLSEEISFYKFLQFEFFSQWEALKAYANKSGIKIIGDTPIYVADDSAEVWSEPEQFYLAPDLTPKAVAGCPPDAFSEDGQLWGSPVYDWDFMKSGDKPYEWWIRRVSHALKVYDVVRIDHFRGFEAFYCIPYGDKDARRGKWKKGPAMELFRAIEAALGENLPIIAEDLGLLTPEVYKLLEDSGFPGMRVLQFAFDGRVENEYLPHNHIKNSVVYIGTHDNDTVMGWAENTDKESLAQAEKYLNCKAGDGFNWAMIRAGMASVADTAIFMMADFMGLPSSARINEPSTMGSNWQWRMLGGCANDWLAGIIKDITKTYGR